MKLSINTIIYRETEQQIKRWGFHLRKALEDAGFEYRITILTKRKEEVSSWLSDLPIEIRDNEEELPIFLKIQDEIDYFLKQDWGDYYISTDIDSIFLGFKSPKELQLIEGQWLRYNPEHQKARWEHMPLVWQQRNPHFKIRNYLDSVHGGFVMLHKEICSALQLVFWREPFDWITYMRSNRIVDIVKTRETNETRNIISYEHMLGWYFYKLGMKIQLPDIVTGVDKQSKYYLTYKGEVEKVKKTTLVFHPVKDEETYRKLISKTGIESYD